MPSPDPFAGASAASPTPGQDHAFVGEINGFIFYGREFDIRPLLPAECVSNQGRRGTEAEARNSPLWFTFSYPSPLFQARLGSITVCGELVQSLLFTVTIAAGDATIGRIVQAPYRVALFPRDRIQAATIAGRPAVILFQPSGDRSGIIFMRDEFSLWSIGSTSVSIEELILIAESIR